MEKAVSDFLAATGVDVDDPNLRDTPRRVTQAWLNDFVDGYQKDAATILEGTFPSSRKASRELVVVTGLEFTSICPHHLLPYSGVAHLAYLPGKKVVGFGRLSALLEMFAHRMVLQEDLANNVARELSSHLGSRGAACILEAKQACLRVRGARQHDAWTHAEAYEGMLKKDGALRRELWVRIGRHALGALKK
ncbi:MAG: GTP cyclohydrolase I [Myxococcaceae bacterium]|nr:GTP cyclohydrolase I [Myxococcaceae bacterium]